MHWSHFQNIQGPLEINHPDKMGYRPLRATKSDCPITFGDSKLETPNVKLFSELFPRQTVKGPQNRSEQGVREDDGERRAHAVIQAQVSRGFELTASGGAM